MEQEQLEERYRLEKKNLQRSWICLPDGRRGIYKTFDSEVFKPRYHHMNRYVVFFNLLDHT